MTPTAVDTEPAQESLPEPQSLKAKRGGYMVLGLSTDGFWVDLGFSDASHAMTAVRQAAEVNEYEFFVAVPMRSWKPVKVTTAKKTIRLFEVIS